MRWLAIILLLLPGLADAQVGMPFPGPGTAHSAGGGGGFTGVGDVVSGAKGHWGTIAYSAASRGSAMLNICDSLGTNCADASSDATTGIVSSTQSRGGTCTGTLVGTTYTPGAHPCVIATMYDDSGLGPCNLAQAGVGNQPAFVPNYSGTVPAVYFAGFLTQVFKASGCTAITLPITMGMGVSVISNSGGNDRMFTSPNASGVAIFNSSGSKASIYNGAAVTIAGTMTAGTMYSLIGDIAAAGANGGTSLNGTRTAGSPSTQNATDAYGLGADAGGGNVCDCAITEAFSYASQLNGTQLTNVTSAMRTNGGY